MSNNVRVELMKTDWILAIATRRTAALVHCNLHQALFTGSANSPRTAGAFLHGEGGKHDGGYAVHTTILFEQAYEGCACMEGALAVLKSGAKRDGDKVLNLNVWRAPASIFETTVHPIHVAIWTREGRDLGCGDES